MTSWTSREPRATAMADSLFRLLFPQIYDVYLDDAPTTHRCEDLDKHRKWKWCFDRIRLRDPTSELPASPFLK